MTGARRAVFLDRDGTLNVEKHYLYRSGDWEWIAGAPEAIREINEMGWLAVVVTNQSGVARAYYTEADVTALHRHVDQLLAAAGAHIDGYYICPHHPEAGASEGCDCRKPEPGMLLRAADELGIDLGASYMVGDKAIDIEAAQRAGVTPMLVRTGYGAAQSSTLPASILRAADVLAAVRMIRGQTL
ncbi:MAG TPA: D-glycero-beta-D-manno-heptose 1,7-bisphosphate 7-phosphatase [Acidocella sp.]|nr:MAG: D-glycero-beta-D-manno-heptose-1,7-bisphosphate 7-phosphatase [Rhodospirillales bacterium 20-64-7]HQT46611.1 D-glycero-beta-D-manno-heptose 1,7-bisphosphate 7-phosphatase [Acidocella sp.]